MTIQVHLCAKCETRPATVKVVKLHQGTANQVWLCSQCAAAESPYSALGSAPSLPVPMKTLEDVLAGFFQQPGGEGAARPGDSPSETLCGTCGLPFEVYKSSLLLGCPDCYKSFAEALKPDLRKFHGATQHVGRGPIRVSSALEPPGQRPGLPAPEPDAMAAQRHIDDLRRQLKAAVDVEDYRLAADLKNRIRDLEAQRDAALSAAQTSSDGPEETSGV